MPSNQHWFAKYRSHYIIARNWETPTAITKRTLVHKHAVFCSRFACGSEFVVSGSKDTTIKVWKTPENYFKAPSIVLTYEEHKDEVKALSVNGHYIFSGDDAGIFSYWDLQTGISILYHSYTTSGKTQCVQFDGNIGYIGSSDGKCTMIDVRIDPRHSRKLLVLMKSGIRSLQFYDEQLVLGTGGGMVTMFDMRNDVDNWEDRIPLYTYRHRSAVNCCRFDDSVLMTVADDRRIRIFDVRTGVLTSSVIDGPRELCSLYFDSEKVVTTSRDRTVKIWRKNELCLAGDMASGLTAWRATAGSGHIVPKAIFHTHTHVVYDVDIDDTNTKMVTCSRDHSICLYDFDIGVSEKK